MYKCHNFEHLCNNAIQASLNKMGIRTRPEFMFSTGSGGIWAGTSSVPVPAYLAGNRPLPGQERVFKIAKRTVDNTNSK